MHDQHFGSWKWVFVSVTAFDAAWMVALYRFSIITAFISFSIFQGQKQLGFVPITCLAYAMNQVLVPEK
jgi:hypothetical protein